MIRKFFASIFSFILLLSITTIGAIYIARSFLSGENLIDIFTNNLKDSTFNYSALIPEAENEKIKEYIDEEKIKEVYGNYITEIIKYTTEVDNTKKPSTDEIKNMMYEYCEKYEAETGVKIDYSKMDKVFDTFDEEIVENINFEADSRINTIIQIIYSNKILYTAIGVAALCIILMLLLLRRSLISVIKHFIVISTFNGLGTGGLGLVLNKVFESSSNNIVLTAVSNLSKSFYKIMNISLIIAAILLIIYIILKILLKKKNKNDSVAKINLDNEPTTISDIIEQSNKEEITSSEAEKNNQEEFESLEETKNKEIY